MFNTICSASCRLFSKVQAADFFPLLIIRLYLAPTLWFAGTNKLMHIASTATWFGNPDWGLGLPFPYFMAYLVGIIEALGAVLLVIGLGVRLTSIPLVIIMLVAAGWVHWDNGWDVIAHSSTESSQRLQDFLTWLKTTHPGKHSFITELGQPVMLNNGIEFAATYFIMLLVLFFYGAGKYFSLDYWITRCWCSRKTAR